MEKEEYHIMYKEEEVHWWYKGLRNLILRQLDVFYSVKDRTYFLDAGCGTGSNLNFFNKYGIPYGLDISSDALTFCKDRGINNVLQGSISQIPFKDGIFDFILSLDVLCQRQVKEDEIALKEILRVLKPGGLLILNLPAFNFLKRGHDKRVHASRRYTKNELAAKLRKHNVKILKLTYRVNFLLPIILLLKITGMSEKEKSDLRPVNRSLNNFFSQLLSFENFLLDFIDLPFGSSVFCVAMKTL